jgi:thiol-disulfide isomerase/thioredoxin
MARTPSNMIPLGIRFPDFELPDTVSGSYIRFNELRSGSVTVVMFLCNHCPYVVHVNPELIRVAEDYIKKGVKFVAISSNDADKYAQDGPEAMKDHALALGYPFPYLYDESQDIARLFDAACTPDIYVLNETGALVYRGRLDESRPGNDVPLSGHDLRNALDAVLNGESPSADQQPSLGCNIKWKD